MGLGTHEEALGDTDLRVKERARKERARKQGAGPSIATRRTGGLSATPVTTRTRDADGTVVESIAARYVSDLIRCMLARSKR